MTSVQDVEPMDVSGVRDNGIKALIFLARSLKWNVLVKRNNPVTITAHDGTQRRLPTNTSIQMGVFQGHLSAIMTHSEEFTPTVELMDHIIAMTKPSDEHARRLRLALGETPAMHRERMSQHDDGHYVKHDAAVTQHIELTDEQLLELEQAQEREQARQEAAVQAMAAALPEGRHIVHEEQARALTSGGWSYSSGIATKRTWSDDTVDFLCNAPGCDYVHDKLLGISGHWKWHVQRGEVDAVNTGISVANRKDVLPPPANTPPRPSGAKIRNSSEKLDQIVKILGLDNSAETERLHNTIVRLNQQVEDLKMENKQLTDDWNALQDLIGRKKK